LAVLAAPASDAEAQEIEIVRASSRRRK